MLKNAIAALAITAGLGVGTVALPATADARPFFFVEQHRQFFHGPFFYGPQFFFRNDFRSDPCHGLKERAEFTGNPYWWHRLHECRAQNGIY